MSKFANVAMILLMACSVANAAFTITPLMNGNAAYSMDTKSPFTENPPVADNGLGGTWGAGWLGSSSSQNVDGMEQYSPWQGWGAPYEQDGAYANWHVEVMVDLGTANDWNTMLTEYTQDNFNNQGDAVLLDGAGKKVEGWFQGAAAGPYGYQGFNGANQTITDNATYRGKDIYFRFWNADTNGAATQAGFVYNSGTGWRIPDSDWTEDPTLTADAFANDANIQGTLLDGSLGKFDSDATLLWCTLVPEPGTFVLFGLGVAVMALRRNKRRQ